jgi:NAD(P)-dependent dehydrogenase (short-subunit alcohol dehydrogenase family)
MNEAKTVLITGAAKRVGRHIALYLADIGYDIAIHYNKSATEAQELAKIIKAKGRNAYLVQADLSDEMQLSDIYNNLPHIDCLINNAAVFEKDNLANLTHKSFNQHLSVNLYAPLQLIAGFVKQYQGCEGNIINITDGIIGWSISENFLSYAISKQALQNSVKLLVAELAPNIKINTIAAGATLQGHQDKADTFDKIKNLMPLQKTSNPDEICASIKFIINNPSITGQVISLAGGL